MPSASFSSSRTFRRSKRKGSNRTNSGRKRRSSTNGRSRIEERTRMEWVRNWIPIRGREKSFTCENKKKKWCNLVLFKLIIPFPLPDCDLGASLSLFCVEKRERARVRELHTKLYNVHVERYFGENYYWLIYPLEHAVIHFGFPPFPSSNPARLRIIIIEHKF